VTHPQMKRYFMTTAEAVALVLQASTIGEGSEIFVLDMGEPVLILDLAINLIRLSGLEPYSDIGIQFTGPRAGEKLYEEINTPSELLRPTFHSKIRIFQDPQQQVAGISTWIATLRTLVTTGDEHDVIEHIRKLVPEYQPSARWGERPQRLDGTVQPSRRRLITGFEQLATHPQK
jgi:FlaA1/EpsC-like NDP-sugar epimerase